MRGLNRPLFIEEGFIIKAKKKVAIVGFAPHRKMAPYDDESFEIWGINDLFAVDDVKRWDRWFQIHHPETIENYRAAVGRLSSGDMIKTYATWDCPVYMRQKHPELPNSVEFPFQELIDKFGTYFNNTISWLLAFAIHEGFEEIHIYGVDMNSSSEYEHQRPSCEYFIGLARGMGINVYIPDESSLLKVKFLYALELERENVEKKQLQQKLEHLQIQYNEAEKEHAAVEEKINQIKGAAVVVADLLKEL